MSNPTPASWSPLRNLLRATEQRREKARKATTPPTVQTGTFGGGTGGGGGTGTAPGYKTVLEEGSALTQREKLNFVGGGITAADDAGNTRTNVTLDADLSAIAALTSAADKLPYATGAQTWALTDLSAFARTVLDDANAAAVRATTAAAPNNAQYYVAALNGELTSEIALSAGDGITISGAGVIGSVWKKTSTTLSPTTANDKVEVVTSETSDVVAMKGYASGATGTNYGVWGVADSSNNGSYGVVATGGFLTSYSDFGVTGTPADPNANNLRTFASTMNSLAGIDETGQLRYYTGSLWENYNDTDTTGATGTETDITDGLTFRGSPTMAAGFMNVAGRRLSIEAGGVYNYDTSGVPPADSCDVNVYYGSTKIATGRITPPGSSTGTDLRWRICVPVTVWVASATVGEFDMTNAVLFYETAVGTWVQAGMEVTADATVGSINTTTSQTFSVKGDWAFGTNSELKCRRFTGRADT